VPYDLVWMLRDGVMLEDAFNLAAQISEEGTTTSRGRAAGAFTACSDDELTADMCARWPHIRPSRESVRTTYQIGSGRARRILGRWTGTQMPPRSHRHAASGQPVPTLPDRSA
jgi:hypothetical protein